jgi:hypothetical protein
MPAEVWIVLFLFQAARSIEALLVSGADIAGNRFAFRSRFSALESDDISWHN